MSWWGEAKDEVLGWAGCAAVFIVFAGGLIWATGGIKW